MISDLWVSLIFPHDKTLCPASPSLQWVAWVSLPHLLGLPNFRPSVLWSAKTTASPSRVTSLSARFPIPCVLSASFVSLSARSAGGKVHPLTPGLFSIPGRLFRFPHARRLRSSRVPRLPLYAHAPLVDPGGVLSTRHSASRTTAFRPLQIVGFLRLSPDYPLGPQLYIFRDSVTRPTHSLHLASDTSSRICLQGHYRVVGSLSSGGIRTILRTHPLGNINQFHSLLSDPKVLDLTRHEQRI